MKCRIWKWNRYDFDILISRQEFSKKMLSIAKIIDVGEEESFKQLEHAIHDDIREEFPSIDTIIGRKFDNVLNNEDLFNKRDWAIYNQNHYTISLEIHRKGNLITGVKRFIVLIISISNNNDNISQIINIPWDMENMNLLKINLNYTYSIFKNLYKDYGHRYLS